MANRRTEDIILGDLLVTSQMLPYESAEDILPDILQIVTRAVDRVRAELGPNGMALIGNLDKIKTEEDLKTILQLMLPAFQSVADNLGNGTLKRLAPLILATTTVVMSDETGSKSKLELVKKADRATVFEAFPNAYFPILFFAGKVTFARFFSVAGLIAKGQPKGV